MKLFELKILGKIEKDFVKKAKMKRVNKIFRLKNDLFVLNLNDIPSKKLDDVNIR